LFGKFSRNIWTYFSLQEREIILSRFAGKKVNIIEYNGITIRRELKNKGEE